MKIAFRTHTASQIGKRHFISCLTLADGLKQNGAHIRLVSRALPVHLRDMLAANGDEYSVCSTNLTNRMDNYKLPS